MNRSNLNHSGIKQEGKKHYSVEEANESLPYLTRVLRDIKNTFNTTVNLRIRIASAESSSIGNSLREAYEESMDKLSIYTKELITMHVELTDFQKGRVKFSSMHNGRAIKLCYELGEDSVFFWHESSESNKERKPLSFLEKSTASTTQSS